MGIAQVNADTIRFNIFLLWTDCGTTGTKAKQVNATLQNRIFRTADEPRTMVQLIGTNKEKA